MQFVLALIKIIFQNEPLYKSLKALLNLNVIKNRHREWAVQHLTLEYSCFIRSSIALLRLSSSRPHSTDIFIHKRSIGFKVY